MTDFYPYPAPTWDAIRLRCKACNEEWNDWLPVHVRFAVLIAAMQSFTCPKCHAGSDRIVIPITPMAERHDPP